MIDKLISKDLLSGRYEIQWDASNYASGIYFLKLVTGEDVDSQKMMLIK